MDMIYSK